MFGYRLKVMAPCAGLAVLLVASACTTGSRPFRAVGADSTPQTEVELPVAVDAQTTAATESVVAQEAAIAENQTQIIKPDKQAEKLQSGVSMNFASDGAPPDGPAAPEDIPPAPEMAKTREEAIQQIREKAAATGKNKPHIFEERKAATQRMSKEEQARIAAEMEATAARNANILSENEAEARSKDSKLLQLRAKSHYDKAVKNIEN